MSKSEIFCKKSFLEQTVATWSKNIFNALIFFFFMYCIVAKKKVKEKEKVAGLLDLTDPV